MTLTDDQLAAVRRAIEPLDRLQQDAFVAALNKLLANRRTVGDGELYAMLRDLQRIHVGVYPNSKRAQRGGRKFF